MNLIAQTAIYEKIHIFTNNLDKYNWLKKNLKMMYIFILMK